MSNHPVAVVAEPNSPARTCCSSAWEEAYQRFETPEEEVRKFVRRLLSVGAATWPRDARIVELFCGRGNGLTALERLRFEHVEGVDLSRSLLEQYRGRARCHVADCRALPFQTATKEIVIVQGGLHHLETLPDDLAAVLDEAHRVLAEAGKLVVVEPWRTPFLDLVHWATRRRLLRWNWNKLDALAVMIENEATTYNQWLSQPELIMRQLRRRFAPLLLRAAWGKIVLVARRIQDPS